MIVDLTSAFPKPNLREDVKIGRQLHIENPVGTMLPMERTNFLPLHSRLHIVWPQISSQLLLPLPPSLISAGRLFCPLCPKQASLSRVWSRGPLRSLGLEWPEMLCFWLIEVTFYFQVQSETTSVRNDPTLFPMPVGRFLEVPSFNICFILPYILTGHICFSPPSDCYSSAKDSDAKSKDLRQ